MNAAPSSRPAEFRLLHQPVADAALADARIDDEGEDPDDPVAVLEAGQRVEGDEPEDLAIEIGDDDLGEGRVESLEPGDDVAGPGGVALLGEESGDPLRVVLRWRGGG